MARHPEDTNIPVGGDADERRIRRGWFAIGIVLAAFLSLSLIELLGPQPHPGDVLQATLAAALFGAFLVERGFEQRLEARRRNETTAFMRIVQGLSRSVSPEAVVSAIVDDLRTASGADHVVVARLDPRLSVLEATLVSASDRVPASTTRLPSSVLEGRVGGGADPSAWIPVMAADQGSEPSVEPRRPGAGVATAGVATAGVATAMLEAPVPATTAPTRTGVPGGRSANLGRPAGPSRLAGATEAPVEAAARVADRVRLAYGLRHTLAEPLVAAERVVGALVLSRRTGDGWSPQARQLLESAATEVSAALSRAYAHEEAQTKASIDALTGLPNRRHFDELADVLAGGRRANDALGVLMVDIDHFKRLNDRYGHATGDAVLRAVGQAIAATVRAEDTPARYGGEEFVVLLRQASEATATDVAERIRAAVAALPFVELFIADPVSVSVGAAVAGHSGATVRELVERADRALYAAKRRGRDQVLIG